FWIRRRKCSNSQSIFFTEGNALDRHFLDTPMVLIIEHVAAMGAQVPLDVEAKLLLHIWPQINRNQVECLLLHWAVFNCIDGSGLCTSVCLKSTFNQVDNGRFSTPDRTHQQEHALTYF